MPETWASWPRQPRRVLSDESKAQEESQTREGPCFMKKNTHVFLCSYKCPEVHREFRIIPIGSRPWEWGEAWGRREVELLLLGITYIVSSNAFWDNAF